MGLGSVICLECSVRRSDLASTKPGLHLMAADPTQMAALSMTPAEGLTSSEVWVLAAHRCGLVQCKTGRVALRVTGPNEI